MGSGTTRPLHGASLINIVIEPMEAATIVTPMTKTPVVIPKTAHAVFTASALRTSTPVTSAMAYATSFRGALLNPTRLSCRRNACDRTTVLPDAS
ncbi:MAG TPA: hypothetical protein VJU15_06605 [Gemmatimonadales bacterium]|nr:hypothetical protein [Gemmatimonadales bacterium]